MASAEQTAEAELETAHARARLSPPHIYPSWSRATSDRKKLRVGHTAGEVRATSINALLLPRRPPRPYIHRAPIWLVALT